MYTTFIKTYIILLLLVNLITYCKAEDFTTAKVITSAVDRYLKISLTQLQANPKISYNIKSIDPRLKLAACSKPLIVEPYNNATISLQKRFTLKVACDQLKRWRIFVPIQLHLVEQVVISNSALPRGKILTEQDLTYQKIDILTINHGYFKEKSALIGNTLKKNIALGKALDPSFIETPKLIRAHQEVTILAKHRWLNVKATGIALSDGGLGQAIKVRNKSSRKVIEARVADIGLVVTNQ